MLNATANYIAADRPDIHVRVNEICCEMATPTRSSGAGEAVCALPRGRKERDGEDALHVIADRLDGLPPHL